MSTVQEIEAAIKKLKPEELKQVHEWLEDFIEDQLEFTEEFEREIAEGRAEIAAGKGRRVKPE